MKTPYPCAYPKMGMSQAFHSSQLTNYDCAVVQIASRRLFLLVLADSQDGQESLLRDIDLANSLHALLALFLLFEQLALAGNIAAITLCQDVFAQCADTLSGDNLGADRGLNRHFKLLPRDEFAHLRNQRFAALIGEVTMNDDGERVD